MIINQSWFCFYEQLSHSDAIDESFFSSREEQLMYLYHYISFNPFFSSYFTGAWTFIQNFHCLQLSIMLIAINVISSAEGSYWCLNVTFWITATSFVLFCIFLNLSFLSLSFWWKLQKQFLVESWPKKVKVIEEPILYPLQIFLSIISSMVPIKSWW